MVGPASIEHRPRCKRWPPPPPRHFAGACPSCHVLASRPSGGKRRSEMDDVVPGREQHQHHDDGKPDAEPDLLGPVAQGAAAQRLDSVEQKVPAIEQRDREQVDQADRHREHGDEADEAGGAAEGRDLARYLRDADRSRELVRRFAADDEAPDISEGPLDDVPGLHRAEADRVEEPVFDELQVVRPARGLEPEEPDALLAEGRLGLLEVRHGGQGHLAAVAVDRDAELVVGARADDPLHVGEARDRTAVDGEDEVAGLESGTLGGAADLNHVDARGEDLAPVHVGDAGEDRDREQEIRDRARRDDQGSLENGLVVEADGAFGRAHLGQARRIRHARAVDVAGELDVAAERDRRELPAGAVAVGEADELGPETDREGVDADAAPAADEEMPELVDEDHDREDDEERDQVAKQGPGRSAHHAEKLHQAILLPASEWKRVARARRSRISCRTSWSIASASSTDEGAFPFLAAPRSQASATTAAISRKPISPATNAATATSFAALSTVGIAPPSRSAARARPRQGKRPSSTGSNDSVPIAARSRGLPESGIRAPSPRQCAIGMRMSGTARPAVTPPSRQCTSPWTTDWGWTRTSSWSCINPNR